MRPRWVSSAVGRASPRSKPSGGARLLVEEARLERLLHGVDGSWAGSIWALSGGASRCLRASSAASSLVRGLFIPMFVGLAVTCIYLRLVRRSTVTKGLVYLSVSHVPGVSCLLWIFSGVVYIGGGWGLLPVVVCVEHDDGVICGGFITGDDFFDTFLCVGGRIFCALLCAVHALAASVSGGLIPADMGAGVQRIILSLQGTSDDCEVGRNCLVRFVSPFAGLLLVDWGWTVGRPVSDPGDDEEMACHLLGRSTDQRHEPLMGLSKFTDSSSIRDSTASSILGYLLYCGRWRRTGLRQRWSAMLKFAGCSFQELICKLSCTLGCPFRGLDVKCYQ